MSATMAFVFEWIRFVYPPRQEMESRASHYKSMKSLVFGRFQKGFHCLLACRFVFRTENAAHTQNEALFPSLPRACGWLNRVRERSGTSSLFWGIAQHEIQYGGN